MNLVYPTTYMISRVERQRSRSQGHKVQKHIEGRRELCTLSSAHPLAELFFRACLPKGCSSHACHHSYHHDHYRRHRLSTVDRVCTQVDVVKSRDHVDLSNYVTNGEWSFVGTRIVRNEVRYPIGPAVYPDVTVYVTMRRRILYYMLNIILPCISLNVLSLLAFCLPPDAGEKITLGITVLLSYSVFMLLVAENMPPTSEFVPLIGKHRLYTESACRSHKVFSS